VIWIHLHGWGSSAEIFRSQWSAARNHPPGTHIFLDGLEHDPLTGRRRWFAFSGDEEQMAQRLLLSAPKAEALIRAELDRLSSPPQAAISLTGHSQGGMLALALTLRGRLNIARTECYATFLPSAPALRPDAAPVGTTVVLYSSRGDRYVSREMADATAERLRQLGVNRLKERITPHLPHAFSPAWLEPASFRESRDASLRA